MRYAGMDDEGGLEPRIELAVPRFRSDIVPVRASGVLALVGEDLERGQPSNLLWFRAFIHMHVAIRTFFALLIDGGSYPTWRILTSAALILACLGALLPGRTINITRLAVILLGLHIAAALPLGANHVFLEFLCLGLLAPAR